MSDNPAPAISTDFKPGIEPLMYAVIDLAVCAQLRPVITRLKPPGCETLFSRSLAPELLEVGPWLVQLSKFPEIGRALTELGEDVPWGYFIFSIVDIVSLRHSLRKFNQVQIPNPPREVLFRYWDPRVMRQFLEFATPFQRDRLFQAIEEIEVGGRTYVAELG